MPEQKTITVYKYDELSDKAKQFAMNHWLEHSDDFSMNGDDMKYEFIDALKEIGIFADKKEFSWSAERGREWFFCLGKNAGFDNVKTFLKYCKVDLRTKFAKYLINNEDLNITISYSHYGGGVCYSHINSDGYFDLTDKEQNKFDEFIEHLDEYLQKKLDEFLNNLEAMYENVTSEEYIKETFEANEYRFDEHGRIE
jgi:hypothetical protein